MRSFGDSAMLLETGCCWRADVSRRQVISGAKCARGRHGRRNGGVRSEAASKETPATSDDFYRETMDVLDRANVPFLVGGAYALCVFTGISRDTKDFDVFLKPGDIERALNAFRSEGFDAEL